MRLAVVSPFVDRRHGTERALAELLERLAHTYGCEIHLYAQRVEDLALNDANASRSFKCGRILWHKIPPIPGPHLVQFLTWICLNGVVRWSQKQFGGLSFDLVLSPGINCFHADAVMVHALFHRLRELAAEGHAPLSSHFGILRGVHRRVYYRALTSLERRLYTDREISLAAVSPRTAELLADYFDRRDVRVIPNGVDTSQFSLAARLVLRSEGRQRYNFQENDFVLLLIGNDWRNKGLPTVLAAMAACSELPMRLLVVGQDLPEPHQALAKRLGLFDRCHWGGPGPDALSFYAIADVYASPTLEDAFALPPLEAMACGLPVITSVRNGGSHIVTDGVDGFVLQDPTDTKVLAELFRRLYRNPDLQKTIGANAVRTAREWNWDRSAAEAWEWLNVVLRGKRKH